MSDGIFSGIAGIYRHFRFGGIGLLAADVERGMADGHGGNATKDGGMRFAFPPYACWTSTILLERSQALIHNQASPMSPSDIVEFLEKAIEPIPNSIYGGLYRAAAYLIDGTYLPCVILQSRKRQVDLALRRFEQLKEKPDQYRAVVESFVSKKSAIVDYKIARLEISPFAWPLKILRMIHGETVMGWTSFVAEMSDGRKFNYGTSFTTEFFDLPAAYTVDHIKEIHSGVIYTEGKGIEPFRSASESEVQVFRERPFFTCYLDGL